ncbi:MAG TPA: mucoidy inhibitor MuiA family protein, partial [Polyangia bacterium]|nr:mucoidy inhibitor MuiA family protein [Polyangia bacterium]
MLTASIAAAVVVFGPAPAPPSSKGAARGDAVPAVVWTAATAASAVTVEARIAEVTVFSDRARVRRRGRAPGGPGVHAVRFPSLPGAVFLDTIRVSAAGGRVLRVEATPLPREQSSVAQANKLLDALDIVADRLAEVDDRRATDDWEVGFLRALAPAPLVSEEKREGRKNPPADVASWWKALDFISDRTRAASGQILRAQSERAQLVKEKEKLLADYKALDRGGLADRIVDVVAIVDMGEATGLELEYFVPGARWKPAYDLHFASATGQIHIETAGVVEQTTGEDWTEVALLLSTARPGRGIDLPERLAWTLGERSEFVPQLHERRPPEITLDRRGDTESDGDAIPDTIDRCPDEPEDHDGVGEDDGCPDRNFTKGAQLSADEQEIKNLRRQINASRGVVGGLVAPAEPPPPVKPAPARVPAPVMAEAPDRKFLKGLFSFGSGSSESTTTVPLALNDRFTQDERIQSNPYLPVVSAGGFDFVYRAPTRATIPSSDKKMRVPVASQTFQTAFFHEATPGMAKTAFLKARVRNDGKRPLLRGPVSIFGDGEFVAVGEIQTTGPGGEIELPLGADANVRIERTVVPNTKTTGLILKSDETSYDVVVQVANYKKQ